MAKSVHERAFLNRPRFLCFPSRNKTCFIGKISSQMGSIIMKPRKPFSLAVAAATLLATSFSPSASAELTDREASIVPIAAFTANGNQEQLKKALAKGLDKGLTVNEIKAVLEQMYAYTGFPRSLTALGVYVKLLNERKAAGLKIRSAVSPHLCPRAPICTKSARKRKPNWWGAPLPVPCTRSRPTSTRTSRITSSAPSLPMMSLTGASGNSPPFRLSRPFRPRAVALPPERLHERGTFTGRTLSVCR